jgi:hypothetical protein
MRPIETFFNIVRKTCQSIHKRRLDCLFAAANALINGKKLSLAGLGRNLESSAKTKHCIKRIDRLLANKKLSNEILLLYQSMARIFLRYPREILILVDWSPLTRCGQFQLLRAAIPMGGRAITIYEETHLEKDYEKQEIHSQFLLKLKEILPEKCRPIIVTDAGFKNPWFKAVQDLGWDWVGRIRGRTKYRWQGSKKWLLASDLHEKATLKERFLGIVELAKSNPILCNFYLFTQKKKHRVHLNLQGHRVRCSSSLKHARREREPWLIASSLNYSNNSAKKIIKIYKTRMQIEESFRDIKNQRNGFSMSETRTKNTHRFNVLLLIGALAYFAMCLIGKIAQNMNKHHSFQSNTIKNRQVLSVFVLGCEIYRKKYIFYDYGGQSDFQDLLWPVSA